MSLAYEGRADTMQDALRRAANMPGPHITLREILATIGDHGPLILCAVLSVPFLLPVSIPGVSTVFGLAILLLGLGITLNRMPWLPRQIMDRKINAAKLSGVLARGIDIVARIETAIRPRLGLLTQGTVAGRVNGLAIVAGAVLLMLPLGLVPFSNTLPACAIMLLCIGMTQRDGALVLGGYAMLIATVAYFSVLAYAAMAAGRGLATLLGSG
ncbi:exopolysaccharide biosynthesis protein [Aquamicrobium zhengzhouense]|nr:exopolysaccharide biosynthesis protein [Aquamicrobium zhengzhouense]